MPKRPLRTQLLQQRQSLARDLCEQQSLAIQKRFLTLPEYLGCELLALYSPVRNEVLTDLVATHARQLGKRLAYPRVEGHEMVFHEVLPDEALQCGTYGICEPQRSRPVTVGQIDLAVVPGVGFDRHGYRLGYGKGYYDRIWGHGCARTVLVGFSYAFQLVEHLPKAAHDLCLDVLLTENDLLRFSAITPPAGGPSYVREGGPER